MNREGHLGMLFLRQVRDMPPRKQDGDDPGFTWKGKVVGAMLASRMDKHGRCYPSINGALVADTAISANSVRDGIRELVHMGLLDYEPGGGRLRGVPGQPSKGRAHTFQARRLHEVQASRDGSESGQDANGSHGEQETLHEASEKGSPCEDEVPKRSTQLEVPTSHSRRDAESRLTDGVEQPLRDLVAELCFADENTLSTFRRRFAHLPPEAFRYVAQQIERRRGELEGNDAAYAYAVLESIDGGYTHFGPDSSRAEGNE